MTRNSPLGADAGRVWALAWPMILSNVSVPLLGAVDTAILGHLDSPVYLAAVAIGASILTFLLWAFGFLRMGTTGLVARAHGGGDDTAALAWLERSLLLAAALGLSLWLLAPVAVPVVVELMNASAAATPMALEYTYIRLFSAPLALANFAFIGWFIGLQDSRAPLLILVCANLLNIVLDALFILGFGWGARGAALATVCADVAGFALALWLARRHLRGVRKPSAREVSPLTNAAPWKALFGINGNLFVRTCALLLTFTFFTAQGAAQGDTVLAANAIMMQLLMVTAYGLDGFAHATEALTGKAIGARDRAGFHSVVRIATGLALLVALLLTLVFGSGSGWIPRLFTGIEPVLANLGTYWPWLCTLPLITVWSYQLDGVFIGADRSREMRDTMLLATALVFFPAWWLTRDWGNHGLWFSFLLWSLARSLAMALIYLRISRAGRWLAPQPAGEAPAGQ